MESPAAFHDDRRLSEAEEEDPDPAEDDAMIHDCARCGEPIDHDWLHIARKHPKLMLAALLICVAFVIYAVCYILEVIAKHAFKWLLRQLYATPGNKPGSESEGFATQEKGHTTY